MDKVAAHVTREIIFPQYVSSSKNVRQLEIDDSSDSESCYSVKTTHGKQWFTKVTMTMDDATRQDVICQLDSG